MARRRLIVPLIGSAALAGLATGAASSARACTLPSASEGWQHAAAAGANATALAFRMQPAQPAGAQMFALDVRLCPARARLVAVDATMPEHGGHGMNYRPSIRTLAPAARAAATAAAAEAPAAFRVEGLSFHMPGHWRLRFNVTPASAQAAYGDIEISYQHR